MLIARKSVKKKNEGAVFFNPLFFRIYFALLVGALPRVREEGVKENPNYLK